MCRRRKSSTPQPSRIRTPKPRTSLMRLTPIVKRPFKRPCRSAPMSTIPSNGPSMRPSIKLPKSYRGDAYWSLCFRRLHQQGGGKSVAVCDEAPDYSGDRHRELCQSNGRMRHIVPTWKTDKDAIRQSEEAEASVTTSFSANNVVKVQKESAFGTIPDPFIILLYIVG